MRIRESLRRLEMARDFEEPDRVPILIDVGAPFFANVLGFTLRDYYRDLQICKHVQVDGSRWAFSRLQDDRTSLIEFDQARADIGAVAEGIVFDCTIFLPEDSNPWLSPWILPKFRSIEDIETLEVPDPSDCVRRLRKHYVRAFGREVEALEAPAIHPPCSAAGSIIGSEMLYTYLYKYPDAMHDLFKKLLETFFEITDYNDRQRGGKTESIGLCDDHAGYLSEEMYRKFVLPYNRRIYERYGAHGRSLHMDSRTDHIARIILEEYRVQEMDLGAAADISKIKDVFDGKVLFNGNVDSKILVAGSTKQIEEATERCIRAAAPGGGYIFDCGGETYAGIDPEKMIYMIRYAKKIGKYPILNL
ncbi:MAG: uroporphyrinogen decarboxylase family protein [Thermoproteota archaeon]